MLVGAGEPAKIGAFAHADAGDEKCHIGLLRLGWRGAEQCKAHDRWRAEVNSPHCAFSRFLRGPAPRH